MSSPQYLDRGTLRELILDFYTTNDPQRLRDGIDINGMVNWTFENSLQALNDMLYEQYGTEIDPFKSVNYNSTENFKRVSAALVAPPVPTVSNNNKEEIETRLVKFYKKHDQSKLNSLEKLVNFAVYRGIDMLNSRLMAKYGEDLSAFGPESENNSEPSEIDNFPTKAPPPPPVMNISGQQFSAVQEPQVIPPKSALIGKKREQPIAPPPPPMDDHMSVMLPPPPPLADFVDPDTIEEELTKFYKAHDPGKLMVVDALAAWVIRIGRIKYNEKLLQLYGYTLDDPLPEDNEEEENDVMAFNAPVERKPDILVVPEEKPFVKPRKITPPPIEEEVREVPPPVSPRKNQVMPPVVPREVPAPIPREIPPPIIPRDAPPPVTPRINPAPERKKDVVENPFRQPLLKETSEPVPKPIFAAPESGRGRHNYPSVLMDMAPPKPASPKEDFSFLSSDKFATKTRDKKPTKADLSALTSPTYGSKKGFKPPAPPGSPTRQVKDFRKPQTSGFKPPPPTGTPKPTPKSKFSKPKSNNGMFTPMPPQSPSYRAKAKPKPKTKHVVPINAIKSTSFNKAAECEGFRLNMTATSFGMCVCGRPRAAHKRLQAGINTKKKANAAVSRVNIPGKSRFGPPPPNYKVSRKPAYGNL